MIADNQIPIYDRLVSLGYATGLKAADRSSLGAFVRQLQTVRGNRSTESLKGRAMSRSR